MPEFPGDLNAYLATRFQLPKSGFDERFEGRLVVGFTICRDGSLAGVHMVRGAHPDFNRGALRVVQNMPRWKPAQNDAGERVDCPFFLPLILEPDGH